MRNLEKYLKLNVNYNESIVNLTSNKSNTNFSVSEMFESFFNGTAIASLHGWGGFIKAKIKIANKFSLLTVLYICNLSTNCVIKKFVKNYPPRLYHPWCWYRKWTNDDFVLLLHMLVARKNCSSKIRYLTKFNGREFERELIRINVDIREAIFYWRIY